MKAYVEGIHYYKTHRKESLAILEKYLKTTDPEALREVYEDIGLALVPEKPYPTLKGIQIMLQELAVTEPKAKSSRPEQFVDMSFVKELDSSGFIDGLYKSKPSLAALSRPTSVKEESGSTPPGVSAVPKPIAEKKEERKAATSTKTVAKISTEQSGAREHTVAAGDTLSHIALYYYGDAAELKWMRIYQANRETLKNPNYIYIGQRLMIPSDV
jgi:LysM repeat protein